MNQNTILLVDDDQDDLELLQEAFAINGVSHIKLVNSAAAAMEYLQAAAVAEQLPNIVITDLYLPGPNGLDLMKEIRSNTLLWNIRVIILSAFKFDAANQMYNAITPENYFEKPNTFQKYIELAAVIITDFSGGGLLVAQIA